jgi:outer membrane protein assembly factor BamB
MKISHAVGLSLLVACKTSGTPAVTLSSPASSATVAPSSSPMHPLIIHDRLVDPTNAATVGHVVGVNSYAMAQPNRDGSHTWSIDALVIDGQTGSVVSQTDLLQLQSTAIVRKEPTGVVRWTVPFSGVRSVRPPDAVTAGGVAVVVYDETLHAFDDATGKPLWTAPGPADRLATDGTYAFVTDCTSGSVPTRSLVAVRLADGKQVWRSPIAAESDPDDIQVDARHVIVRDTSRRLMIVFDHSGKEVYRVTEAVESTWVNPFGMLVFGDKTITQRDDAGRTLWTHAPLRSTFVAGNDVVPIQTDILIANHGRIDDSGVDLVRLRADTGALVWEARIPGLGVAHSQYLHLAYLDVQGNKVFVVSQASGGSFFERVDLATGKREARCDPNRATCVTL